MGDRVEGGVFFEEIGEGVDLDVGVVDEGQIAENAWG